MRSELEIIEHGVFPKEIVTAQSVDEVNNPKHYKLFPDMEAFDVIKASLSPDELRGYLKGNVLKYRLRAGEKGPAEKCIAKAEWYKARLFEQENA
ncbi:TPA: DUF3310 domain-containing protein [Pseudomonas aeruginosa]|uniref:DUF3310 domain-containing protein n=1 Tax=Pseudomonas aeruginosa TaxID=287 RepID=UPI0024A9C00C|nr:DUF3310 domain-containing protein [Pseudomonas aeruginosa]MDI3625180.1 DUF3310 domain-containing protein [Pseudomonas aeruginosa]HBO4723828.1 DUF3310 domain-containing protein [Pseudomonas aeruginosa]